MSEGGETYLYCVTTLFSAARFFSSSTNRRDRIWNNPSGVVNSAHAIRKTSRYSVCLGESSVSQDPKDTKGDIHLPKPSIRN
jgi:hypothetical protein